MPKVKLALSQNKEADRLLSEDPYALLIGMVLDQQVPLEWAFSAPLELRTRLGGKLDVSAMAAMDADEVSSVFLAKPALHRYPASMAQRVHALSQTIMSEYGGDPAAIWSTASDGKELLRRVKALPGFGEHKARIFVALLGKQLGVRPDGWEQVSAPFSEPGSMRSVADIVDEATLAKVRDTKQAAKREAKAAAATKTAGNGKASAPAKRALVAKTAPPKRAGAKAPVAKQTRPKDARHGGPSADTSGADARRDAASAARRRSRP